MDNRKLVSKLLDSTNFSDISDVSDFSSLFIQKLIYNLIYYTDDSFTIGHIEMHKSFYCENGLTQTFNCNADNIATIIIDGDEDSLLGFANLYSQLQLKKYDILAREAITDFLNLNNELFAVYMTTHNAVNTTVTIPKQNGNYTFDLLSYKSIIAIPIVFSFGTIYFYCCEAL